MASAPFALEGDDPLLSPDVLTGADPSLGSVPPDPLADLALTPPIAQEPTSYDGLPITYGPSTAQLGIYGPTIGQLGTNAAQIHEDPTAFNASPTTGSTPGASIWDNILGVSKLGLSVASIATNRATTSTAQTGQSKPVAQAKGPGGAGTSSGLVWFAILAFVGIVFWLEFKSGH